MAVTGTMPPETSLRVMDTRVLAQNIREERQHLRGFFAKQKQDLLLKQQLVASLRLGNEGDLQSLQELRRLAMVTDPEELAKRKLEEELAHLTEADIEAAAAKFFGAAPEEDDADSQVYEGASEEQASVGTSSAESLRLLPPDHVAGETSRDALAESKRTFATETSYRWVHEPALSNYYSTSRSLAA